MHGKALLWFKYLNFMTKHTYGILFELQSAFSKWVFQIGIKSTLHFNNGDHRAQNPNASGEVKEG